MTPIQWRARATLLATLCLCYPLSGPAVVIAALDFDDASGGFDTSLDSAFNDVTNLIFNDDLGRLTDYAGVSGRAFGTSGFTSGNLVHLTLLGDGDWLFTVERLLFDLRASAAGPKEWGIQVPGADFISGSLSTDFTSYVVPVSGASALSELTIDLLGTGASSVSGTLRLDNLIIEGQVSAVWHEVAEPGTLFVVLLLFAGLAAQQLPAWRRRKQTTAGQPAAS